MAIMYPIKGLSCTGVICPLAIPLPKGVSGLQGTMVLGPPLGMRTGLLPRFPLVVEPLATGVMSKKGKKKENDRMYNYVFRYTNTDQSAKTKCK